MFNIFSSNTARSCTLHTNSGDFTLATGVDPGITANSQGAGGVPRMATPKNLEKWDPFRVSNHDVGILAETKGSHLGHDPQSLNLIEVEVRPKSSKGPLGQECTLRKGGKKRLRIFRLGKK